MEHILELLENMSRVFFLITPSPKKMIFPENQKKNYFDGKFKES